MRLERTQPLASALARAAQLLRRAERQISLLERVRPLNLSQERARLAAARRAGQRPQPELRYAPPPELGELRLELSRLERALVDCFEARLLAERAAELELEAALAERVGRPSFGALAARRFPCEGELARACALSWLDESTDDREPAARYLSDDAREPKSLYSLLSARIFGAKLAARLEVQRDLPALAAVADGVVLIRAGAELTLDEAERIVLHEVEGHLMPRLNGEALRGVFAAGSRDGSRDEEGRALMLEARAAKFRSQRRKQIARRYLAAETVRRGATLWETVEHVLEAGASVDEAVELACRVHRGGGLARESVYLLGYLAVKDALEREPELDTILAGGRVGIAAASGLLAHAVVKVVEA